MLAASRNLSRPRRSAGKWVRSPVPPVDLIVVDVSTNGIVLVGSREVGHIEGHQARLGRDRGGEDVSIVGVG